jgi:hypothetical protein
MISEFMQTDLPEPVVPAMSRCGQLGDVAHDAVAADVLAEGEGQLGRCVFEFGRVDDVPEIYGADQLVGHLDAHGGYLVGNRRDAHAHATPRASAISPARLVSRESFTP